MQKNSNHDQSRIIINHYALSIAIVLLVIAVLAALNLQSGIVIEKSGQQEPIINWTVQYYGYSPCDDRRSNGWYVLVLDGSKYTTMRLTESQYSTVQVGAKIVRVGAFVLWINPR